MSIDAYLKIAGTAHRRRLEVRSEMQGNKHAFPKGADDTQLSEEVATCEAIIALARARLFALMLQLRFDASGHAIAEAPRLLRDGEYDQGKHVET